MNRFVFIFLFASIIGVSQTDNSGKKDKKGGVFKDAGDAAKMVLAKQKLYGGQFVSALNMYREVEKNDPKNSTVL